MPKFKLLKGKHVARYIVTDEEGTPCRDKNGDVLTQDCIHHATTHTAKAHGKVSETEIVESDEDLVKQYPGKFKLID